MATPLSPLPFEGFSITLAGGVVSEAVFPLDPLLGAPYSNTKEVIINNLSTTDTVLVQIARVNLPVPGGLPAAGTITAANSTVIPPSSAIALCIGVEGERAQLATNAFWFAIDPTSSSTADLNIVFLSAGSDDINITYVQSSGGGGSVGGGC